MVNYLAIKLKNELSKAGKSVPIEELDLKLRSTIFNFNVNQDEAFNIVKNQYLKPEKFVESIKEDLKDRQINHNLHNFEEAVKEHYIFIREYQAYCKRNEPFSGKRPLPVKIKDINEKDVHISIEATLIKLWNNTNKSIKQIGLLKDDTGIIKFVSFNGNYAPVLELNKIYVFRDLVTNYYNNSYSVLINKSTIVKESIDIVS
jgi:hypothetical protein